MKTSGLALAVVCAVTAAAVVTLAITFATGATAASATATGSRAAAVTGSRAAASTAKAAATVEDANGANALRPAVWTPYALIIDVTNLPKRYTCDELWYKFRDVLFAVGARPDMKVLPYRCESALRPPAYKPKVQLEFSVPGTVSPKNAKWASMQVTTRSVRLAPGALSHIDEEDCDLLRLMKGTLLKSIGIAVKDFRLACRAPSVAKPPFGLTVQVLMPTPESSPEVASAQSVSKGSL